MLRQFYNHYLLELKLEYKENDALQYMCIVYTNSPAILDIQNVFVN